jgi:hypothetical protein
VVVDFAGGAGLVVSMFVQFLYAQEVEVSDEFFSLAEVEEFPVAE